MKRLTLIVLSVICLFAFCAPLTACGGNRSEILKILVPGEYIDPDIFGEFEDWYKEQTGKKISVLDVTFETNEELYVKIEKSHADYDLVCPSDYTAEKLINNGLAVPIDKSVIDVYNAASVYDDGETVPQEAFSETLIREEYIKVGEKFDKDMKYNVPYMYGTFGLMYDYSVTGKHLNSWDIMFESDMPYKGKLTQKKSVREAYSSACIYAAKDELSKISNGFTNYTEEYNDYIQSIYEDESDATIAKAKALLKKQKKRLLKYEVDDGKFGLANGSLGGAGGLYWSCDAGYVMASYEDDDGKVTAGNKNLWYVIPKEGGNVYIDTFLITRYAENVSAANMFLKFICKKEYAMLNSYYAGAISPVASAYDSLYEELDTDEDGFFDDTEEGWKEMYMEMLFPSAETLLRCGVMKEYKHNESKINLMIADIIG